MHKSRAIWAFERRLIELGCPARYSRRSVDELAEHFEDSIRARIEEGAEPAAARAQASKELGNPTILAERVVASFRLATWWGRHPVISFCLLPPLVLMVVLPIAVLSLYGLFLLGNLFSHHAIPLDEFKSAVSTAPGAFAEWNDPLLYFIHSVPIAITTILFCKLVARTGAGVKWLTATCAICAASGFFTWTGFSVNGFYLGYGSPAIHNWISTAIPLLIGGCILFWRQRNLALLATSGDGSGVDYRPQSPWKFEKEVGRPRIRLREEWFTPTSAVTAAIVVISFLLVKFVFSHDKADHARMEALRNRIWPVERKATLDFLRMRQSINETPGAIPVSLRPSATSALTDPVCWFGKTNFATLAELPRGLHTFAGVPFVVDDRIQLMGNGYKGLGLAFPTAIKGIPVSQKCQFLYLLHGASFVRTIVPSVPDEKGFLPVIPTYETTNLPIARLVLHYADQGQAEIKIFTTQHLLDVWGPICGSEVPVRETAVSSFGSELAWTSKRMPEEKSEMMNSVRVYKSRFENPRPDARILTLDYVSTRTDAAPFLLGLTIK